MQISSRLISEVIMRRYCSFKKIDEMKKRIPSIERKCRTQGSLGVYCKEQEVLLDS
jgi:hypothetical protein